MKSYLVYFADRTARLYLVDTLQDLFSSIEGHDFTRVEFFPYEVLDIRKED